MLNAAAGSLVAGTAAFLLAAAPAQPHAENIGGHTATVIGEHLTLKSTTLNSFNALAPGDTVSWYVSAETADSAVTTLELFAEGEMDLTADIHQCHAHADCDDASLLDEDAPVNGWVDVGDFNEDVHLQVNITAGDIQPPDRLALTLSASSMGEKLSASPPDQSTGSNPSHSFTPPSDLEPSPVGRWGSTDNSASGGETSDSITGRLAETGFSRLVLAAIAAGLVAVGGAILQAARMRRSEQ